MAAGGVAPFAVLLPLSERRPAATATAIPLPVLALLVAAVFVAHAALAGAPGAPPAPPVLSILTLWTPAILRGFLRNIGISLAAMLLATALGTMVGLGLVSERRAVRGACWCFTQFFRNAPWLVVLFYCMMLLPFVLHVGSMTIPIADDSKAVLGIAIAAAANMAEIVRGAIQSIPTGQWESADSLAFTRRQTIWMIILPQCTRRMLPGWMNLYAMVVVSTPLCAVVGVREAMTAVADMLAAYSRPELLMPAYSYLLVLFFLVCSPIAWLTRALERRFAVA